MTRAELGSGHVGSRIESPVKADPGAVPSLRLGGVQGAIGPVEDRAAVVLWQGLGQAGAEGNGPTRCMIGQCRGGKARSHLIEHAASIVEPDVGQDQQELLASNSADVISGAQPLVAGLSEMPGNGIAGIMPVSIVDVLEPIDVDDCGTRAGAGHPAPGEGLVELLEHEAPVSAAR